jgi:hypothetical protein
MKSRASLLVAFSVVATATAMAQNPPAPAKAAPGQADALGKAIVVPDKSAPMPDHFVVLRHQEGDDWDYAVIRHLGPKAEVSPAPAPPNAARDLRAWHDDTFASGPSWTEFTRQMGIGGSGSAASAVYVVGVHRAVPGHREQLGQSLNAPGSSKIQTGTLVLQHIDGGDWTFMTITRYNSWQDFATDRAEAAAATGATAGGWADIRQHSGFHRDTIADRLFPAK